MTTQISFLRLPEVARRTGLSRSTIYQRERDGSFPRHVKLSPRVSAWRSDEIAEFIEARTAEARSSQ